MITGATSGLGLAVARALVAGGATVEVIARGRGVRATPPQRRGGRDRFVVADIGDLGAIRNVSDELVHRHGEIHVLINKACALDKRYTQSRQGIERTVATAVSVIVVTPVLVGSHRRVWGATSCRPRSRRHPSVGPNTDRRSHSCPRFGSVCRR